jgi:hypothetical protein
VINEIEKFCQLENGQTLFEEKSMIPNSVWMDLQNRPIIRNEGSEKEEIPLANVKLYGGQQFERLLSEFKVSTVFRIHKFNNNYNINDGKTQTLI